MATRMITRRGVPVQPRSRFEFYAWLFTRISGVILLLMAVFHILYMHFYLRVDHIDYNVIAERWNNPLWRVFDFTLLAFGFSHGMNGARVVLAEYLRGALRKPILIALGVTYVALILMGAWIIFTFKSV
jgi:succinate dehydrogenase / fumarate reductase, membrane anchor subunit